VLHTYGKVVCLILSIGQRKGNIMTVEKLGNGDLIFTGNDIHTFQFEAIRGGYKIGKFTLAEYLRKGLQMYSNHKLRSEQAIQVLEDLATASNRSKYVRELKREHREDLEFYYRFIKRGK
tara:strand:+ start:186 stop:545 length:360 start_codon:yes stop_codon:yes gene_type:complete